MSTATVSRLDREIRESNTKEWRKARALLAAAFVLSVVALVLSLV